jgi:SPFH domain / Band 7 family
MTNFNDRRLLFSRRNLALLGLGLLVPLIVIGRFVRIVPVGKVGVIEQLGKVSDQILDPGLHFVNPISRIIELSTQTQELKETTQTPSQDGLIITADVSTVWIRPRRKSFMKRSVKTMNKRSYCHNFGLPFATPPPTTNPTNSTPRSANSSMLN